MLSLRVTLRAFASFALVALMCARVHADAKLPDGTTVPLDSANGETQLFTFFTTETEAVDWIADAHTSPDTFSPLCGFTATLMLKQSGSSLGVGWYNVIDGATAAPLPTDIYEVVPAGSAVGTTIDGMSIRSDTRYLGGLIGFALIRAPAHFTETKWNTQCTLCSMPGPWILALTYKSVNTPNAFYVAFEDGNTTNFGWSNDGDYNDYVFRFTGLTCAGGGEPCKVDGKKGMCAEGLTECDGAGMLVCKALVKAEDEVCDGVDNDCNGEPDDKKNLCEVGLRCVRGTCVPPCGDEFPCGGSDVCEEGLCVHPKCVGKTCDSGEACIDGKCEAPCDGVKCPVSQVCRVGRCVDPCEGVTCADGYVCDGGACVLECSCGGCPDGRACNDDGRCVEAGCETQTCENGDVCVAGACVDACDGVACPRGEVCRAGACETGDVSGAPDAGPIADGGALTAGTGSFANADSGPGSGAAGEPPSGRREGTDPAGCGCKISSLATPGPLTWLWGGLLSLTCLLRLRRKARAARG